MNILLCSVGRRVPIVEYFCRELAGSGKVVAVDCSRYAPALYVADHYEIVPAIDDPAYLPALLKICRRHRIRGVLSLIDPELSRLSAARDVLQEEGVELVASCYEVNELCLDKKAMYDFLTKHALPAVPTYDQLDEIFDALDSGKLSFPLLCKPRWGSASIGLRRIDSLQQLDSLWSDPSHPHLVVQPFLTAAEYGIDAYVDLHSSELISMFCKQKINMRAGETDKAVSVHNQSLEQLTTDLLYALPLRGPIDIDCFQTDTGFVISEINPRFGGGYPHAYECGVNFIRLILHNLAGIANVPGDCRTYPDGSIMVKYEQIRLL
ncbi:ATP-grasp domain-containing protein [Brevibacillus humidisoli]|uniref:ATP-grasp domain-containing protein n=1 Tax=Brevibacillus humidisoli TaxID=2895522 RepID=UPI001E55DD79|nr:ATP-grasp domain-containing protein [Brevibacillus humidisoli]UFJ42505.1 ATP-grasp domain-containing protein [Brevibacillus humidisoli]